MLVSRQPKAGLSSGHGSLRTVRAELLNRNVAVVCEEGLRQRLFVLARRLRRVQALGNEFARVGLSEQVRTALDEQKPVA